MTDDLTHRLSTAGWDVAAWHIQQPDRQQPSYSFRKTYPEGVDVIVTIHQDEAGFVVRSSAESRTSGPSEAVHGTVTTRDEALRIAQHACEEWDHDMV